MKIKMKMKILPIKFNITILYFIIYLFIEKVFSSPENNTIKILIDKPDIEDPQYLEKYSNFTTNLIKNTYPNVDIKFSYCDIENYKNTTDNKIKENYENYPMGPSLYSVDEEYAMYMGCIIEELKISNYDMAIINNRVLFSDESYIRNMIIEGHFRIRNIREYLYRYDNTINSEKYSIYEKNLLDNGFYKGEGLYGLPYELDFNLLYYHKSKESDLKLLLQTITSDFSKEIINKRGITNTNNHVKNIINHLNNNSSSIKDEIISKIKSKLLEIHNSTNNNSYNYFLYTKRSDSNANSNTNSNPTTNPNSNTNSNPNTNTNTNTNTNSNPTSNPNTNTNINSTINLSNTNNTNDNIPFSTESNIFSVGLGNNDELLDLFIEYLALHYDISNKSEFFDLFTEEENETSETNVYKTFLQLLNKYTMKDLNSYLNVTREEAFHSFINNKKIIYKGKASDHKSLQEKLDSSLGMMNQVGNYTILDPKYLVINNHSTKDRKLLKGIAFLLTDKNSQLSRAEEFGHIPTLNIKKELSEYCLKDGEMCDLLKGINPINVKTVFQKNSYSASFMEVRLILPSAIHQFLNTNNETNLNKAIRNLIDINKGYYYNANYIVNINIMAFALAIVFIIIMILNYRYRNHPYLKSVSPKLSNITIFGVFLNIIYPSFHALIQNETLCHIFVVSKFFIHNLIFLPILAIIFRIYYIHNNLNKVNFGKKLNDKHLFLIIVVILLIAFCLVIIVSVKDTFYLTTLGSLVEKRIFWCNSNTRSRFAIFSIIYYTLIVLIIIVLIIKSSNFPKSYGLSNCFYFIIVFFISSVSSYLSYYLLEKGRLTEYGINFAIYLGSTFYSIYILAGSRILYILRHPIKEQDLMDSSLSNEINIADFTPNNEKRNSNIRNLFKKPKKGKVYRMNNNRLSTSSVDYNSSFDINNNDEIIENNPNNYFFNLALEKLNQENSQDKK